MVGVDVQRIRRTLGLSAGHAAARRGDGRRRRAAADRPRPAQPLRAPPAARARTRPDRAHRDPPPSRPLAELDRALPTSPTQDLAAVHRAVSQMKRRLATLGHEQRGRASGRRRSTCGARCAPRWRPAACRCTCATGRSGRAGRRSTCSATSRPRVTSASVFFLSVLHALHDSFRKLRSFVFIERICEVTEIFEHERDFREIAERDLQRGRRRRRLRLHRLRPRLARVPRRDLRRPRPALDRDRARRRPHQRPRAPRRGLRPASPSAPAGSSGSTPSRASTGTTATR